MSAVVVQGVSKVFNQGRPNQVDALVDIDLTVEPAEFVSLIGPSGCGKSTLLRLIADLIAPTTGSVTSTGRTRTRPVSTRSTGWRSSRPACSTGAVSPRTSSCRSSSRGGTRSKRADRAREMLDLVKLGEFADHRPWQLSGGMQQRVAIARALAAHPPLLLMDEPFGALDEMTREHMQAELLRICAETGTSVVFVTHSIPEAVYLSDRVVVMSPRPGRITDVVTVDLGGGRDDNTREDGEFFKKITEVREALRAHQPGRAERIGQAVEDR